MRNPGLTRRNLIEAAILAVLALGSLFYIVFRDRKIINYTLPVFPVVSTDQFSLLEIIPPEGDKITLEKDGGQWLLSDNYPAAPSTVNLLLDSLETLEPVDLVSDSGNYGRYELEEDQRTILKAYKGENLIREIYLGKPSASENYNYVQFPGSRGVYTLRGALIKTLRQDPKSFRDTQVLQVNRNGVTRIETEMSGIKTVAVKGPEDQWTTEDGAPREAVPVEELLGRLTSLNAVSFPDSVPGGEEALAVIRLSGEKSQSLTIFEKTSDGYPAQSSDYPFPFVISAYTGDALVTGLSLE
jgi:hypothetical protein